MTVVCFSFQRTLLSYRPVFLSLLLVSPRELAVAEIATEFVVSKQLEELGNSDHQSFA